jgi:hypothetical protein
MAKNLLTVIFKPEDLQRLLDQKPNKVVIRSILEEGILENGQRVGYVKVYAEGKTTIEGTMLETVPGCPDPPCSSDDDTSGKDDTSN